MTCRFAWREEAGDWYIICRTLTRNATAFPVTAIRRQIVKDKLWKRIELTWGIYKQNRDMLKSLSALKVVVKSSFSICSQIYGKFFEQVIGLFKNHSNGQELASFIISTFFSTFSLPLHIFMHHILHLFHSTSIRIFCTSFSLAHHFRKIPFKSINLLFSLYR